MRQSHGLSDYPEFAFNALDNYPIESTATSRARSRETTHDQLYTRLANQFDSSETGFTLNPRDAYRRFNRPSDEEAAMTVAGYSSQIDQIVARVNGASDLSTGERIDLVPGEVDPQLLRAVMFMEVRYNPDPLDGIGKTKGVMNVNYDTWENLLGNHGISEDMLSKGGMVGNPPQRMNAEEVSIYAAAMILSHIDASIPEEITGEDRVALIASMYGNTELTLEAGRPIMYGGKALEVMEELYPSASLVRATPQERASAEEVQATLGALVEQLGLGGMLAGAGVRGDEGVYRPADASPTQEVYMGM